MKRAWLLCALLAVGPLLGACSYASLERQVYPICLSVDLDEKGRYQVGVQAPQSSTESGAAAYDLLTATGDSFSDAMRVLSASTPYPFNFSQVRLCLLSYDLASTTHLRPLLRTLFEMPSMRPDAYVMVALGNAAEVMAAQKPDLGMRLSTHLNLLFEQLRQESMLPYSSLSACVQELGDGKADPLLCICAVNRSLVPDQDNSGGGASGDPPSGSGQSGGGGSGADAAAFAGGEPWAGGLLPEDILAGLLPQTSVNPVEYLGSAAVSEGRVSGLLTARETQIATLAMIEGRRAVAIDGEQLQLQLFLPASSALAQNRDEVQAVLKKLKALGCDSFGFGWHAAGAFYTDAQLEAYGFRRRFREAQIVTAVE